MVRFMYYLFIIKDNFFKNNSEYLYEILYKLKTMHKENYSYGISLYYNICKLWDFFEVLPLYHILYFYLYLKECFYNN